MAIYTKTGVASVRQAQRVTISAEVDGEFFNVEIEVSVTDGKRLNLDTFVSDPDETVIHYDRRSFVRATGTKTPQRFEDLQRKRDEALPVPYTRGRSKLFKS